MKFFDRHDIHKLQRQVHSIYQDEPVWMVFFGDFSIKGDYNTFTVRGLTYPAAAKRVEELRKHFTDVHIAIDFFQEQTLREIHISSGLTAANTNEELIAAGFRKTSHKYGLVSRIDRPDWIDVIIVNTHQDAKSIRNAQPGRWEDHYRRCHSRDSIELGNARGRRMPSSSWDAVGYVEVIKNANL